MTDPCCLPSAIMQTTAALIGIFAVVYVLAVPGLRERAMPLFFKYFPRIKGIDFMFFLLLFVGLLTIYLNAQLLDSLSMQMFYGQDSEGLADKAWFGFKWTLILVGVYSFWIIFEYRNQQ